MWLTDAIANNSQNGAPFTAVVASGGGAAVQLGGETGAQAELFLPYGMESIPPKGERTAVIPSGSTLCAVGVRCGSRLSLEPGEVGLFSSGGASIVLKNDGRVLINGADISALTGE